MWELWCKKCTLLWRRCHTLLVELPLQCVNLLQQCLGLLLELLLLLLLLLLEMSIEWEGWLS